MRSDPSVTMGGAAYTRLKAEVMSSVYEAGERLDLAGLARDQEISVTPIREAAIRLLGEGLLTIHAKGGFAVPRLTPRDLSDALELHRESLLLALSFAALRRPSADHWPTASGEDLATRAIFEQIAVLGSNGLLLETVIRLNDRLEPFRRHEGTIIAEPTLEAQALARGLRDRDLRALRGVVRAYHRRRIQHAARLVWTAASSAAAPRI